MAHGEGQLGETGWVECRLPGTAGALSIRGDPGDESVIGPVRRWGEYASHLLRFLASIVEPDWTSLDVGANVGIIALFLSRACPDGAVHAFEPVAETFRYLVENLRANAATNVVAHHAAISDRRGELVLRYPKTFSGGAFSSARPQSTDPTMASCTAPAWPLDEWVSANGVSRVDLVKVDIEGGELAALQGARGLVSSMAPDLLIELNPVVLRRFQARSWQELIAAVRELYPHVFYVRGDGAIVEPLSRSHWRRLLGRYGLLDLYATFDPNRAAAAGMARVGWARWIRGAADWLWALVRLNCLRAPTRCFVVEPKVEVTCPLAELRGRPGDRVVVPVRVHNRSRFWLSSDLEVSPVYASWRWVDDRSGQVLFDGGLTRLSRAVRPGASVSVDLDAVLPASPGRYRLMPTLFQVDYAWLDELTAPAVKQILAVVG